MDNTERFESQDLDIDGLQEALDSAGLGDRILVVDDSTDIKKIMELNKNGEVIGSIGDKVPRSFEDFKKKLLKQNRDAIRDFRPTMPLYRNAPKVGRNEPCPCGSGIKYKKCCGRRA